ncbi:uncharacterized protein LOC141673144 [Apium graveolens]|uniref:uncharacterized protein LOC141673144 n=1 Tax=Apium graveolens TaxID=4045 RepID=UPI003D7AE1CE
MKQLGFDDKWIAWMLCVTTVSYSMNFNGTQVGPINPSRGLRQGDPLSPYLFLFSVEGLSRMIQKSVNEGKVQGCRICTQAPAITHLLFADDNFLFCRSEIEEVMEVKAILQNYELHSGQAIYFSSNVRVDKQKEVKNILGVYNDLSTGKYLGLLSLIGRSKKTAFNFLKDHLWSKLQGRAAKSLSKAECLRRSTTHKQLDGRTINVSKDAWIRGKDGNIVDDQYLASVNDLKCQDGVQILAESIQSMHEIGGEQGMGSFVAYTCPSENKNVVMEDLQKCCSSCWHELGVQLDFSAILSYPDWLLQTIAAESYGKLEHITTIMWGIWSARNFKVWQNKLVTAQQTIQWSATQVKQWRESQQQTPSNNRICAQSVVKEIKWKPPSESRLKVNVDAHVVPDCNWFSCGFILRDHRGHFIRARTHKFAGTVLVMEAEAIAVREAIRWIISMGMDNVDIESDSLCTVNAVNSGTDNLLEVGVGWQNQSISRAGKVTLLKTAAQWGNGGTNKDATVAGLLDEGKLHWDEEILNDLCNERDREFIKQVPVTRITNADTWFWLFNDLGKFTVRSCYRRLRGESECVDRSFWRKLWKLKLPGKVVNLVWCAYRNCLHAANALATKGININTICSWCEMYAENDIHVLFQCCFAREIWDNTGLSHVLTVMPNDTILEQAQQQRGVATSQQQQPVRTWNKPGAGWIKINTDVACYVGSNKISVGCVIRDDRGSFVCARSNAIQGTFHPREAEAVGLKEALSWVKDWRRHRCVFECDSKVLVDAAKGEAGTTYFHLIVEECRDILKHFEEVLVCFIHRSANIAAHNLAQVAYSTSGPMEWLDTAPNFLNCNLDPEF